MSETCPCRAVLMSFPFLCPCQCLFRAHVVPSQPRHNPRAVSYHIRTESGQFAPLFHQLVNLREREREVMEDSIELRVHEEEKLL